MLVAPVPELAASSPTHVPVYTQLGSSRSHSFVAAALFCSALRFSCLIVVLFFFSFPCLLLFTLICIFYLFFSFFMIKKSYITFFLNIFHSRHMLQNREVGKCCQRLYCDLEILTKDVFIEARHFCLI